MNSCARRISQRTGHRIGILAGMFLGVTLLAAIPSAAQYADRAEGDYVLDRDHATLLWKVNHLGFSTYVGRFNSLEASLKFNPEFPIASKLSVVIDAASLDVNNPDFAKELRGKDWFDTESNPEIRFVSTYIKKTGIDKGKVTGDLTFMGVTRPVTLDVTLTGKGRHPKTGYYTLGFEATGTLKRSDFKLSNLVPLIGDDVTLEIHAEFSKK